MKESRHPIFGSELLKLSNGITNSNCNCTWFI